MHVMRSVLYTSALLSTAMAAVSLPAQAQTRPQTPVEFEGPIQSIEEDGSDVKLKVNGIVVTIPNGLITGGGSDGVHTPTARLTSVADVVSTTPFAGRPGTYGFVGGTAIVVGISGDGGVTATDVFMEPAENVILGAVTANSPGDFRVEGVKVYLLAPSSAKPSYPPGIPFDPRLPGLPMKNELGFAIDPAKVQVYADAALEGYFGKDVDGKDAFYAFSIDSVSDVEDPNPTVSILRAQCRVRSTTQVEWEIRGGVYPWVQGATIGVYPPSTAFNGGRAYATNFAVPQDTVDPKAGAFRYTAKPNATGGCPSSVVVKFNGAPDAVANVEVR
ncbi:hypothetical protein SAE02_35330 [Skermanella aerolata]|uniref:DUF5666 domain-containing protein n=2 Tax=Skermanella aerolata TaxID=393310 RepID=A0A512DSH0_9PROT|nr:hypothetical protein SAE02_35330 [Skermanella aerolata]